MEPQTLSEPRHSKAELGKLWSCQSLIREWASHPQWKSYDVLPSLYRSLHSGKRFIPGVDSPTLHDSVRKTETFLSGSPADLLPDPVYIYLLTTRFSDKLDEILKQSPKTVAQAIRDAAFAYYVFDRIHPFPDGNGRIGRMIVKRIFKAAGLKDPLFHDQRWYGGKRSTHLDTLERVDDTNNLAHMELFLAQALMHAYDPVKERTKYEEVKAVIEKEKEDLRKSANRRKLSDIWEGFSGILVYGNRPN